VPFGEFLPFENIVLSIAPILAQINAFSNLDEGERSTYFYSDKSDDSLKVGTLICFDSIYEQLGIDSAREGAEIFIIPSNDSWFFDSRALNMHHAQNILRTLEQRKYSINCGNTGITSIVNYRGEVINSMPIETEGYIIDTVYASSGRSVYSYIGNLFVYLCVATVISVFAYDAVGRKKFLAEN
jgi:apolipoprotein N-acyltransferase